MCATCGMPSFLSFKVPIHLESPTFSNVKVLVSVLSDLTYLDTVSGARIHLIPSTL